MLAPARASPARVLRWRPTMRNVQQRPDLVCVSLSDPEALKQLEVGDFVIIARGRRYFSNDAIISALRDHATPIAELKLGPVPSAKVYELDQTSLTIITKPLHIDFQTRLLRCHEDWHRWSHQSSMLCSFNVKLHGTSPWHSQSDLILLLAASVIPRDKPVASLSCLFVLVAQARFLMNALMRLHEA